MAGGSLPWLGVQTVLYLILTFCYASGIKTLTSPSSIENASFKEGNKVTRWVLFIIVLTWLISSMSLMFSAPAGESHDIFDYVFRGRMMTESTANPLAEIPKDYRKTAFFRYVAWHSNVDTYGPLWEFTSQAISGLTRWEAGVLGWWLDEEPVCPAGKDSNPELVSNSCRLLALYLVNYRVAAVLLSGFSGLLVFSIVRRHTYGKGADTAGADTAGADTAGADTASNVAGPSKQQQNRMLPLAAVWVWLLSPVTLISSGMGAHNDFLMIALLILAVWLVQRSFPFLGLVVLLLSAHVKLTALIWVPVFAAWIWIKWGWRRSLTVVGGAALFGTGLSWLLYQPFGGWYTLPQMLEERSRYLANSIWRVIYAYFYLHRGWDKELVRMFSVSLPNLLFFLMVLLICAWLMNYLPRRWRRSEQLPLEEERRFWMALSLTGLLYLIAGAYWFQHWYILWVLAPAALLPASVLTSSLLPWLGFGALTANISDNYLFNRLSKETPKFVIHLLTVGVIWAPFFLAGYFQLRSKKPLDSERH